MERKKSLGQCFLEDKNILALEAKLAEPQGKTVLEIGPGDGRLTEAVLALKPRRMIAVEKDSRFASLLKEKFAGRAEIVEGDFLKAEPPACDIVIGNIPYYISSDIVFTIAPLKFERAVLMVQKEFAQKMVAKAGEKNYGRLSVTAQLAFEVKLERIVPRHLFRPVPKVDSAIIILTPTGIRLDKFQEDVIPISFLAQEQAGSRRSHRFQIQARGIGAARGLQGTPGQDIDQRRVPGDSAAPENF